MRLARTRGIKSSSCYHHWLYYYLYCYCSTFCTDDRQLVECNTWRCSLVMLLPRSIGDSRQVWRRTMDTITRNIETTATRDIPSRTGRSCAEARMGRRRYWPLLTRYYCNTTVQTGGYILPFLPYFISSRRSQPQPTAMTHPIVREFTLLLSYTTVETKESKLVGPWLFAQFCWACGIYSTRVTLKELVGQIYR